MSDLSNITGAGGTGQNGSVEPLKPIQMDQLSTNGVTTIGADALGNKVNGNLGVDDLQIKAADLHNGSVPQGSKKMKWLIGGVVAAFLVVLYILIVVLDVTGLFKGQLGPLPITIPEESSIEATFTLADITATAPTQPNNGAAAVLINKACTDTEKANFTGTFAVKNGHKPESITISFESRDRSISYNHEITDYTYASRTHQGSFEYTWENCDLYLKAEKNGDYSMAVELTTVPDVVDLNLENLSNGQQIPDIDRGSLQQFGQGNLLNNLDIPNQPITETINNHPDEESAEVDQAVMPEFVDTDANAIPEIDPNNIQGIEQNNEISIDQFTEVINVEDLAKDFTPRAESQTATDQAEQLADEAREQAEVPSEAEVTAANFKVKVDIPEELAPAACETRLNFLDLSDLNNQGDPNKIEDDANGIPTLPLTTQIEYKIDAPSTNANPLKVKIVATDADNNVFYIANDLPLAAIEGNEPRDLIFNWEGLLVNEGSPNGNQILIPNGNYQISINPTALGGIPLSGCTATREVKIELPQFPEVATVAPRCDATVTATPADNITNRSEISFGVDTDDAANYEYVVRLETWDNSRKYTLDAGEFDTVIQGQTGQFSKRFNWENLRATNEDGETVTVPAGAYNLHFFAKEKLTSARGLLGGRDLVPISGQLQQATSENDDIPNILQNRNQPLQGGQLNNFDRFRENNRTINVDGVDKEPQQLNDTVARATECDATSQVSVGTLADPEEPAEEPELTLDLSTAAVRQCGGTVRVDCRALNLPTNGQVNGFTPAEISLALYDSGREVYRAFSNEDIRFSNQTRGFVCEDIDLPTDTLFMKEANRSSAENLDDGNYTVRMNLSINTTDSDGSPVTENIQADATVRVDANCGDDSDDDSDDSDDDSDDTPRRERIPRTGGFNGSASIIGTPGYETVPRDTAINPTYNQIGDLAQTPQIRPQISSLPSTQETLPDSPEVGGETGPGLLIYPLLAGLGGYIARRRKP